MHGAQKTSSSEVASHKGDQLFFVMTAKRHQEFSTNFSTKDSRIISEKSHSITPFYLLKHFILIELETKVTWPCSKVYLFFLFPFQMPLCEIIIIQSLNDIEKGLNWQGKCRK